MHPEFKQALVELEKSSLESYSDIREKVRALASESKDPISLEGLLAVIKDIQETIEKSGFYNDKSEYILDIKDVHPLQQVLRLLVDVAVNIKGAQINELKKTDRK